MRVDWKAFKTATDAQAALQRMLPEQATATEAQQILRRERFECSELVDYVLHCSIAAGSKWLFARRKWLAQLYFENGRLKRIEVREGLTGP
jgi:hypothetical protein